MKKTFRIMLAAMLGLSMLAFTACKEKEEDTPDQPSTSYSFIYDGQAVEYGASISHAATFEEVNMDFAHVHLLFENKTSDNLETCLKIELVEGPAEMNDIMICFGEECKNGTCTWTSSPFTLKPGVNSDMLVDFEYFPSRVTSKTTYRFTLGKGTALADPQVMLVTVS